MSTGTMWPGTLAAKVIAPGPAYLVRNRPPPPTMRLRPCLNPPPPPPVFVVCDIMMPAVIQASSPCVDTTSSPCSRDTWSMGIVVPLISACMAKALLITPPHQKMALSLEHKVLLRAANGEYQAESLPSPDTAVATGDKSPARQQQHSGPRRRERPGAAGHADLAPRSATWSARDSEPVRRLAPARSRSARAGCRRGRSGPPRRAWSPGASAPPA